jgi:beta-glucosidase/6-phospho-beta-glucosidase/beta-galactosidase
VAFPDGFWWGTAASSTQAEGAAPESDWIALEQLGVVPPSGSGNGFATRFAGDFALYAAHGLTHHRLSIGFSYYSTTGVDRGGRFTPLPGRRSRRAVGLRTVE